MKNTLRFALGALILGISTNAALAEADCLKLSVEVKHAAVAKPDAVLELIERQVAANPSCACEIVKAAVEALEADAKTVAAIVETAAQVAPDQMRLISQCAVAVAPDSLTEVQMVMARLEPGKGETSYSDKSAKSPKAPVETKPAWNPLDFPGQGIGPNPGGPGGFPWLPPEGLPPGTVPPIIIPPIPPIIEPPVSTPTDFDSPSRVDPT